MSSWTRSEIIALGSLIVAIIVALADKDVQCFLRLQSEFCPTSQITQTSPSEPNQKDEQPKPSSPPPIPNNETPPSTTVKPDTNFSVSVNLISKSTGVDYNPLRELLEEGKFKEADQETTRLMLQASG